MSRARRALVFASSQSASALSASQSLPAKESRTMTASDSVEPFLASRSRRGHTRVRRHLMPEALKLPRHAAPRVQRPPRPTPGEARRTSGSARCWRDGSTSCPRRADPRGRLDHRANSPDLQDRRVEITGPVDRKMIINALNSGASVFMADFEDANSPTWENCIQGQINLRDAVRRDDRLRRARRASNTR